MGKDVTTPIADLETAERRIAELEQEVIELRRLALEVRDLELGVLARAKSADWLLDQNDKSARVFRGRLHALPLFQCA